MKSCPECRKKTIPYKWIFFGISEHKNGRCFRCTNCGSDIKKRHWFWLDIILYNDLVALGLLLALAIALFHLFDNFLIANIGAVTLLLSYYMAIELFAPLRKADESYCRGDMTRIGALLAFIFVAAIVVYTVYTLVNSY